MEQSLMRTLKDCWSSLKATSVLRRNVQFATLNSFRIIQTINIATTAKVVTRSSSAQIAKIPSSIPLSNSVRINSQAQTNPNCVRDAIDCVERARIAASSSLESLRVRKSAKSVLPKRSYALHAETASSTRCMLRCLTMGTATQNPKNAIAVGLQSFVQSATQNVSPKATPTATDAGKNQQNAGKRQAH